MTFRTSSNTVISCVFTSTFRWAATVLVSCRRTDTRCGARVVAVAAPRTLLPSRLQARTGARQARQAPGETGTTAPSLRSLDTTAGSESTAGPDNSTAGTDSAAG